MLFSQVSENNQNKPSRQTGMIILTLLLAGILYFFLGNYKELIQWHRQGEAHYQLMTDIEKLGGVNGMIQEIKKKLKARPNDKQGWLILGKLYMATGQTTLANDAFKHADLFPR